MREQTSNIEPMFFSPFLQSWGRNFTYKEPNVSPVSRPWSLVQVKDKGVLILAVRFVSKFVSLMLIEPPEIYTSYWVQCPKKSAPKGWPPQKRGTSDLLFEASTWFPASSVAKASRRRFPLCVSCLLNLSAVIAHPHRESDGKVIIMQHWTVSQNWAVPHLLEWVFQPQDDSQNVSWESLLLSHLAVVFQPHPALRPLSEFPSSQVFVTSSCSTRIHFHSLKWLCGDYSCCRLLWNLFVMF